MEPIDNKSQSGQAILNPDKKKLNKQYKEYKALQDKLLKAKAQYEKQQTKENLDAIKKFEAELSVDRMLNVEAVYKYAKEQEAEIIAEREREAANRIHKLTEFKMDWESGQTQLNRAIDALGGLKKELDDYMSSFLQKQESIAYNINGSSKTFKAISWNLTSALAGTGFVKQEEVYNNLAELTESGLIYNVEQNAFLNTLASDLGMMFKSGTGTLPRLFALQRADLSSNRMAIEASLKTFLNQNYQTSQYIKEGFTEVSNALIEAQSMMTAESAVATEAVVQKWIGSLSSTGLSSTAVTSFADVINKLGSGNISELVGSDLNKLVILGAQSSNLSYADLLLNGINETNINTLFQGMLTYLDNFSSDKNNVVYSEIAKIFGLSTSDLKAASNLLERSSNLLGVTISSNINELLSKLTNYVTISTRVENSLDNLVYQWATGVASDEIYYATYKVTDILANAAGTILDGIKVGGIGTTVDLGTVTKLAPLLVTLPSLIGVLSKVSENSSYFDENGNLLGKSYTPADMLAKLAGFGNNINVNGNVSDYGKDSGYSTSGNIQYNTNTTDLTKNAKDQAKKNASETMTADEQAVKDANDIWTLLAEEFLPGMVNNKYALGISTVANTVSISNASSVDNVLKSQLTTQQEILKLLKDNFSSGSESIISTPIINNKTPGGELDW